MTVIHHYQDVLFPSGDYLILSERCEDEDFVVIVSDRGQVFQQVGSVRFPLIADILWVQAGIMQSPALTLVYPVPIGSSAVALDHVVGSLITNGITRRV